jgi:hypothetical protein
MLTGELPIGRFAPPSAKTPVNAHVDEVVLRTLEKDREKRFQSAGEMKTEVEHLEEGKAAGVVAAPPAATGPRGATAIGLSGQSGRLSRPAVWGAVLTGLGLLLVGGPFALVLLAGGGLGVGEFLLFVLPGGLCALAGTILGWVALNDLRETPGTLRGLPLAVFAALAWPLLLLVAVALGLPMLTVAPTRPSGWALWAGRALFLLLPAGVLTFALWAVHATTRWASGRPIAPRRGVLKWVFAGVLAVGLGVVLLTSGPREDAPAPPQPTVTSQ